MSAERPPIPPIYTTSKEIGVIAKEIDWIFVEGFAYIPWQKGKS